MAVQRAGDDDLERALRRSPSDGPSNPRNPTGTQSCGGRGLANHGSFGSPDFARRALGVVERVTTDLAELPPGDRRTPPVRTLRQALGYRVERWRSLRRQMPG